MQHIGTNRTVWLALGATALALIATSRLTSGPQGPACVEQAAAQPGFSAMSSGVNPACIRIYLH